RPDREFCLARNAREFVPGTHGEAIVAAEDAVGHGLAKLRRDMSLMLDGEVGDAGARIELIGRDKGPGRANIEATAASAAMILLWRIGSDLDSGEDRAEEQPRAEVARNE